MAYGTNAIPTAEPPRRKPRQYGVGRLCEGCKNAKLSRYTGPTRLEDGTEALLCGPCVVANRHRVTLPQRGMPPGVSLPGLAKARKAAGLTQSELALRVGRTFGAVSNVERGATRASKGFARELAKALGVPLLALTTTTESEGVA